MSDLNHWQMELITFCIFSWTGDKMHLDRINLDLTGNKLVLIVGPVGCGKVSTHLELANHFFCSSNFFANILKIVILASSNTWRAANFLRILFHSWKNSVFHSRSLVIFCNSSGQYFIWERFR